MTGREWVNVAIGIASGAAAVILGILIAVAVILATWEWYERRRDRQTRNRWAIPPLMPRPEVDRFAWHPWGRQIKHARERIA